MSVARSRLAQMGAPMESADPRVPAEPPELTHHRTALLTMADIGATGSVQDD
ncbi:MAG: hypothetical protein ABI866_11375 [Dokdonella sp.]